MEQSFIERRRPSRGSEDRERHAELDPVDAGLATVLDALPAVEALDTLSDQPDSPVKPLYSSMAYDDRFGKNEDVFLPDSYADSVFWKPLGSFVLPGLANLSGLPRTTTEIWNLP